MLFGILAASFDSQTRGAHPAAAPVAAARVKPAFDDVKPAIVPLTPAWPELFPLEKRLETPRLDVDALLREDEEHTGGGPARVGIVEPVHASSFEHGTWTQLAGGDWLWTMSFKAPDAKVLRLRLAPFRPPAGVELILYNAANPDEAYGPFPAAYWPTTDEFWSPMIFGEEARLEYIVPKEIDPFAPGAEIVVDRVLNQYRALGGGPSGTAPSACHLDVTCFPAFQQDADGVGALFFTNDMLGFVCSGFLLNRVETASDFTSLFFTATHCLVTPANVNSAVVTWFFQTATCNMPGTAPAWFTLPQTQAAVVLASDQFSDWTMVGMVSIAAVPGGTSFLGWNSGSWDDGPAVGIHHPRGSFKRISFGNKVGGGGSRPDFTALPACRSGSAWEIDWPQGNGLTEPGSSGSPVFDGNQQVRGLLSCGPGPNCPNGDNSSDYGRLEHSISLLQPYLDPVDPIFVNGAFSGTELGTVTNPFNTVFEGTFAVIAGSNIHIEAGNFNERFLVDKPMTLNARNGVVTIGL